MQASQAAPATRFKCRHCEGRGAQVGQAILFSREPSRIFQLNPFDFALVVYPNCGHTEIRDLKILDSKDKVDHFLESLFPN